MRAAVPDHLRFPVEGSITVRPDGGYPFRLFANRTSYLAKQVYWGGPDAFEPAVLDVVRRLAPTTQTFVDVGANIGYYPLLVSAFNPRCEIIAFEPSPSPYKYLLINRRTNRLFNVSTERLALSDAVGEMTFFAARNPKYPGLREHLGGTGSLDRSQAEYHGRSAAITVRTETLDGYVTRTRLNAFTRVDLLKVDVEGAEGAVLRGAERTLIRDRPTVIFEGLNGPGEASEYLKALGYRVSPARRGLPAASDAPGDFVAVHPDRSDHTDLLTTQSVF